MSTKKPKVSVIIPNYNHARYLPQRIESVLKQTVSYIEVVILDDCSPDNSREIIEKYASQDSRIRVVYNEENSGSTFKQWNKGFALAQGEYIWIAESDDYADEYFLEKLVSKLDDDPEVGLVYCDSWNLFEYNNTVARSHALYAELDPELWEKDFCVEGNFLIRKFMSYRNVIPNASAVVFRRSIAERAGPADEKMRLVGDWLYWASIFAISKVCFVAEPLNYFRHHSNNVRSKTLVNGIYFYELTLVLAAIKSYGNPDEHFYSKTLIEFFNMWFEGVLRYDIPLTRNYAIYKNMTKLDKPTAALTKSRCKEFLLSNNYSALRQLLGDKTLYPIFRKVISFVKI
ncbi:glycosyltransferase family 2 protein [Hymenobacter sp. GOD-10R]|uniref:glycosyltransferase family 2 protein n=1 Tax=Hymenobacter sp. GOD-10R TaxID=3093922 RepID=UPI002D77B448|nr:glycosyltransferase [Hymenobacter sp. GOD-10R]WRQ27460.1 glycosyltransferase [Hymenobacter sp. GOD-10R]